MPDLLPARVGPVRFCMACGSHHAKNDLIPANTVIDAICILLAVPGDRVSSSQLVQDLSKAVAKATGKPEQASTSRGWRGVVQSSNATANTLCTHKALGWYLYYGYVELGEGWTLWLS